VSEGALELAERMQWHAVGRAVGNVRNNSPELIEPIDPE
jgi:putative SOS response-associated peptidase YedK